MAADSTDAQALSIAQDQAALTKLLKSCSTHAAAALGLAEYQSHSLRTLMTQLDDATALAAQLQAKLTAYETAMAAAQQAAKDAQAASDATIAANQTAIDGLNATIKTLQDQIAAGNTPTDLTALIASLQADVDSIPTDAPPVVIPVTPTPTPPAASGGAQPTGSSLR